MDDQPLISIIVPTKNSAATVARCLESILNQSYPTTEVILVDNYSTDSTKEIAEGLGIKAHLKGPERNPQRNFGVEQAKGEYLLFIDSDMELGTDVVAECLATARREGAQAVAIPEESFGEGFWTKCKALERSCYTGEETMALARFFEREAFHRVGGFDDRLVGFDDRDLHFRIVEGGGRIGYADAVIRHNEGRVRISNMMRKKYLYGKTLHLYLSKHKGGGNKRWLLLRLTFVKHWDKLVRHPVLAMGMAFMQACELGAAGVGYLVGMVKLDGERPQ